MQGRGEGGRIMPGHAQEKRARPSTDERTDERLDGLVTSNEEIMGGAWVFRGTRVPVDTLFDALR